ncbi:hypothetical protein ACJMK2_015326 [Sinanodonta woodiana]|uniref:VWFA domain-containing protein n=1 Tax=Sinanodonta woodiana TaxID=1069815 RepID=A0ABD3V5P4_SINWO
MNLSSVNSLNSSKVVNAFNVGQGKTRVGAINFSNKVTTAFNLKTYDSKQYVLNAISAIKYTAGHSTDTFDALSVLRTEHFSSINGDRSDVPNIAIRLTDGESGDMERTRNEAKLTREAGVSIFAIGIGDSVKKEDLEEIASSPKTDSMHIIENFTTL